MHTGYAGQFYTCAGTPRSKFGAMCGKRCALFKPDILFLQNFLPPAATILIQGHNWNQKKSKLSKDVHRSEYGGVTARLCLEEPIWLPLPKEGVT